MPHDIFRAVKEIDFVAIEKYINEDESVLALKNEKNLTPVGYAAIKGLWPLVTKIVNTKVSPKNEVDGGDLYGYGAALIELMRQDKFENKYETIIQHLLNQGAEPTNYYHNYQNALDLAIYKKNAYLVRLLIKHGAYLKFDPISLVQACILKEWNIVSAFEKCEKLTLKNKPAFEELIFSAIEDNRSDIVRLFVKKGVNTGCKNKQGQTPFQYALAQKKYECIAPLILPVDKIDTTTEAEAIYNLLKQNGVDAAKIPGLIVYLEASFRDMLEVAKKNLLKKSEQDNLSAAEVETITTIINSFQNFPGYSPSGFEMQLLFAHPETTDLILKYMQMQIDIQNYYYQIRDFLFEKKFYLLKNGNNLGRQWHGIPLFGKAEHVDFIQKQLEKLNSKTENDVLLEIYVNILDKIFNLAPSEDRTDDVKEFDKNFKKEITRQAFISLSRVEQMFSTQESVSTKIEMSSTAALNEKLVKTLPKQPIPSAPMQTQYFANLENQLSIENAPPTYDAVMAQRYATQQGIYPTLTSYPLNFAVGNLYPVAENPTMINETVNPTLMHDSVRSYANAFTSVLPTNSTGSSSPFEAATYPPNDKPAEMNEAFNTIKAVSPKLSDKEFDELVENMPQVDEIRKGQKINNPVSFFQAGQKHKSQVEPKKIATPVLNS